MPRMGKLCVLETGNRWTKVRNLVEVVRNKAVPGHVGNEDSGFHCPFGICMFEGRGGSEF